jgi:hypothetical protein
MASISTIQALDHRIAVLESELIELKRRRNALTQISRLPSEIIVTIIERLQHDQSAPNHGFLCQTYDRSWTRITAVCHMLRTIALQTPALWTILNYHTCSEEWIKLSSSRAGDVSLHVSYRRTDNVNDHWSQVQSAELYEQEAITTALAVPAPNLRTLGIYANDDDLRPIIDAHLLTNVSMRLTFLKLEGTAVKVESAPPMPFLQRLEIKFIRTDLNLEALRQFLSQASNLEVLLIRHLYLLSTLGAVTANEVMAVPAQVSLPQLQELFVEDTPAEAYAFLRIVSAPSLALGVSTTHLRNFSNLESALNDNHTSIYNSWLSFSRAVSNPIDGSIRFDHTYNSSLLLGTITFGTVMTSESFGRPANFCSLVCQITDSHPMLNEVKTLVLCGNDYRGVPYEGLDSTYGLRFLPGLHTLILEDLSESDKERMKELKEWVIGRSGTIKKVQLVGCNDEIVKLAEEWREAGLPVV